jgi:hypothetical protein
VHRVTKRHIKTFKRRPPKSGSRMTALAGPAIRTKVAKKPNASRHTPSKTGAAGCHTTLDASAGKA